MGSRKDDLGDGASAGKIFIGGLAKETSLEQFVDYFGNYGEITDSIILKDRQTGRPRGFGFITYADPSSVEKVFAEVHVINGKQVEIKKTTPRGSSDSKVFKTKKIFVGGIPASVTEDELESFFSKFGKVVEHQIIKDHATKRSRGFGFVVFDSDQVVDDLLVNGSMIDMAGTKVEVKKAEPKKPSNVNSAPAPVFGSEPFRARGFDGLGNFGPFPPNSNSNFGPLPYDRPIGGRYGGAAGELGGGYGGYGVSDYFGYRGEPYYSSPFGLRAEPTRFGPYDSGYNNSGTGGGMYRGRAGYSGARYHPYSR